MKNNISVSIKKELLEEIRISFPDKNRSQVIEEALEHWTQQKRKNDLRRDAEKLISFAESDFVDNEIIGDGLDDL